MKEDPLQEVDPDAIIVTRRRHSMADTSDTRKRKQANEDSASTLYLQNLI
jgi:hypothetical protein